MEIYFFDFDGTITKKDSFKEFIFFSKGYFLGYIIFSFVFPIFLVFKLFGLDTGILKEKIISFSFKNTCITDFKNMCKEFNRVILPNLIKSSFQDYISKINISNSNVKISIVSASIEDYLLPWCLKNEFDLISTRLEYEDGKITGRFLGKNCNGLEKVRKIKEKYDLKSFNEIFTFGDSEGDLEMLKLGTKQHYRFFK